VPAVVDRSEKRCGDNGPDARQLREPLAGFVRPAKAEELPVELVEPEIESAKLVPPRKPARCANRQSPSAPVAD
jgi:hypothetical protein